MMLADAMVIFWAAAMVGLGIIGFVIVVFALIVRFIASGIRWLLDDGGNGNARRRVLNGQPGTLCPRARCGHLNRSEARFCARCGSPLASTQNVDAYG